MRKLIFQIMLSLDGFYERTNGDISWHTVDEEFNQFAIETFETGDASLFGRVNYELFASYWPPVMNDPTESESNRIIARRLHEMKKYVFSRMLSEVTWNNSVLVKEDAVEFVRKLKEEPGKDIATNSSTLALALADAGLFDEYRIILSPTVIGEGHALLEGIKQRQKLNLVNRRVFNSGNVLLCYHPVR